MLQKIPFQTNSVKESWKKHNNRIAAHDNNNIDNKNHY